MIRIAMIRAVLILMMFCAFESTAQTRYSIVRNHSDDLYPGKIVSRAQNIVINQSDFYISGGIANIPGDGTHCVFVASYDYSGQKLWQKNLPFAGQYNGISGTGSMIRINENRLVLVALEADVTIRDTVQVGQPYLYFFNNHGDSLNFVKYVDSLESRVFNAITLLADGNLLAVGTTSLTSLEYNPYTRSYYYDSCALFLAKYDTIGNKIWERRLFSNSQSITGIYSPTSVIATPDGGAVIAGSGSIGTTSRKVGNLLIKVDSSGNPLWQKNYTSNGILCYYDMDLCPAAGGGYYFISSMATLPPNRGGFPGNSLFYYGRLRENGDTLWTKGFALPGGSGGYKESFGQKLIQDMAGNLALLGETYYDGRFHATLVRTDSNGKVLSYREYAYKDSIAVDVNKLYTLKATPQNGILMVGVVANQDADPGYWDTTGQYTWIVQTDSLGCLSKDCDKADTIWHPLKVHGATAATFSIYPNPVSNHFTIEGAQGAAISLTNSIGQRAMNFTMTGNKQLVDISALPSGVYILQLTDANGNRGATRILKH